VQPYMDNDKKNCNITNGVDHQSGSDLVGQLMVAGYLMRVA
jgi:hypothetical protein